MVASRSQETNLTEEDITNFCTSMPNLVNKFRRLNAKNECTICLEEKPLSATITLHGKHQFCKDCLIEQLDCAWKDRADPSLLLCPHQECDYELQESDVRNFSRNDKTALKKFDKITLGQLLRKNPNMRLCPGVDCDFVYEIPQGRHPERVICPRNQCGKVFWPACQESHNPVGISCTELVSMKDMTRDQKEKATTQWLDKNTKPCSSCGERIEKNEGCQYVKCKTCQELYCWFCEQSFGKSLTGHQDSLPKHGWH